MRRSSRFARSPANTPRFSEASKISTPTMSSRVRTDTAKSDPQGAVMQFEKAAEVESTPEIAELLRNARQQAPGKHR